MPECIAARQLRIKCMSCPKFLPQALVLKCSEIARTLARELEQRERLESNPFYPVEMQVDCRRIGCVGIGYTGHETIMCMICQEQWEAEEDEAHTIVHSGKFELLADSDSLKDASGKKIVIKRCPRCKIFIEKNGGCNHMRCAHCKHEFWWTTGKPYRIR